MQFGWGSKQRRIQAAEVDRTSAIAESIAQDKGLTKRLLAAVGVPVPAGGPVRGLEDAWAAMQEIGGPVVVTPRDGSQGCGVAVNIETREQLEIAYAAAREIGHVMVERFVPGHDFRLLVVGDRLLYRGATVIADYGHHPDAIRTLVAAVETMPAGRRSVVISAAGDRHDEDIREQTAILGQAFDDVVLYEDACQRGRTDGEVIALLRAGLDGVRRASHVDEVRGEFKAIDLALARLRHGDVCVILVDQVEEALANIAAQGAVAV